MSEMVERVAKAIYNEHRWFPDYLENDPDGVPWERCLGRDKDECREMARAAIEAMREPTEEVRQALGHIDEHVDKHSRTEHGIRVAGSVCWQRGIDAALGKPGMKDR